MTIATNRESLDNGSPGGCLVRGVAQQVINGAGTTRVLTANESGALCVFGAVAGQIYTLPAIGANDVGMYFDFCQTITRTSNSYTVDATSAKIGGGLLMASTTVNQTDFLPAAISTSVSIDLDGATTGGELGCWFRLTAISTAAWYCGGMACGVGTMADPFA